MGSYQPQRSRSNLILGDEKHTTKGQGRKIFNEREREREREREELKKKKQYLWAIDQIIKMALFKYSSRIITILSTLKSVSPPHTHTQIIPQCNTVNKA